MISAEMAISTESGARDLTIALGRTGVEVDSSSLARAEYSADASLYRAVPQAVVFPRDPDDVEAVLSVCRSLAGRSPHEAPGRPSSGIQGIAQPHCHQHAVLGWDVDQQLLRVGGASVRPVGGCCGLAGNVGAERGHFEVSKAVAETALLPAVRELGEEDVVLADGFSCRTQLDHLAGRRSRHLAEVLAEPPTP